MKKTLISGLAITAIALISVNATASDVRYPAANFQPKVVYINEEAITPTATATAADSTYPAANFQAKVIYSDTGVQQVSAEATPEVQLKVDPKYPAANFQPRVIYP